MSRKPRPSTSDDADTARFVADGYERLLDGIEAEVRPEVEEKYANEWNAAGLLKRWRLQRRLEREIAERIAERSQHVGPDTLF